MEADLETIKINKDSKKALKVIAAQKDEKMYEVMDRLVQQEVKRLKLTIGA
jgi:hypothetical protein